MDRIINWFLLVIIFVFDPLAISLIIAANFAFNQLRKTPISKPVENPEEPISPTPNLDHNQLTESLSSLEKLNQDNNYDFQWKKDLVSQEINNIRQAINTKKPDDDTKFYF
jgi:hypothetical protein